MGTASLGVGGRGLGEIAESLIGSEKLFTNEPQSDWTKQPASLVEMSQAYTELISGDCCTTFAG